MFISVFILPVFFRLFQCVSQTLSLWSLLLKMVLIIRTTYTFMMPFSPHGTTGNKTPTIGFLVSVIWVESMRLRDINWHRKWNGRFPCDILSYDRWLSLNVLSISFQNHPSLPLPIPAKLYYTPGSASSTYGKIPTVPLLLLDFFQPNM